MENITKEINIIGNGFFNVSNIRKELPCVTCNFMHLDLNPIATITGDIQVLEKINLKDIQCKIIIRKFILGRSVEQQNLLKEVEREKLVWLNSKYIYNGDMNTGQAICEYLIQEGYTKLNLYGITSRFNLDLSSESDKFYSKDISNIIPLIAHWNIIWDNMITHYSHITFNFIEPIV